MLSDEIQNYKKGIPIAVIIKRQTNPPEYLLNLVFLISTSYSYSCNCHNIDVKGIEGKLLQRPKSFTTRKLIYNRIRRLKHSITIYILQIKAIIS